MREERFRGQVVNAEVAGLTGGLQPPLEDFESESEWASQDQCGFSIENRLWGPGGARKFLLVVLRISQVRDAGAWSKMAVGNVLRVLQSGGIDKVELIELEQMDVG